MSQTISQNLGVTSHKHAETHVPNNKSVGNRDDLRPQRPSFWHPYSGTKEDIDCRKRAAEETIESLTCTCLWLAVSGNSRVYGLRGRITPEGET